MVIEKANPFTGLPALAVIQARQQEVVSWLCAISGVKASALSTSSLRRQQLLEVEDGGDQESETIANLVLKGNQPTQVRDPAITVCQRGAY